LAADFRVVLHLVSPLLRLVGHHLLQGLGPFRFHARLQIDQLLCRFLRDAEFLGQAFVLGQHLGIDLCSFGHREIGVVLCSACISWLAVRLGILALSSCVSAFCLPLRGISWSRCSCLGSQYRAFRLRGFGLSRGGGVLCGCSLSLVSHRSIPRLR